MTTLERLEFSLGPLPAGVEISDEEATALLQAARLLTREYRLAFDDMSPADRLAMARRYSAMNEHARAVVAAEMNEPSREDIVRALGGVDSTEGLTCGDVMGLSYAVAATGKTTP